MLDKGAVWAGAFPAREHRVRRPTASSERLRESGRGALFIGSHLGNLEVLRAYADFEHGIKVNPLVLTRNSPKLNRLIATVGPRALEQMIQVDSLGPDSVIKLQDKIRAGEYVAIAADRVSLGQSRTLDPRAVPRPPGAVSARAVHPCEPAVVPRVFALLLADR